MGKSQEIVIKMLRVENVGAHSRCFLREFVG